MKIYCRTSGLPFAESLIARNPEIPSAVERQSGSPQKRNSIVAAKTAQIAVSNTTEWTAAVFDWRPYNPNVSILALNDAPNTINQVLVRGECSVLPVSQPFRRSDPQAAI